MTSTKEKITSVPVPDAPVIKNYLEIIDNKDLEKEFLEEFETVIDKRISIIKSALEGYYPDKWDFIKKKNHNSLFVFDRLKLFRQTYIRKHKKNPSFNDRKFDYEISTANEFSSAIYDTYYEVIIHFPHVIVRNARKEKHTIKDLYMKLEFNPFLYLVQMTGTRATRSWIEETCKYTQSHLHSNHHMGDWCSCCLGDSPLATLFVQLRTEFDENNVEFYIQQLQDYVSWESLEGGPYYKIANLVDKSANNIPSVNSDDIRKTYYEFIKHYSNFPTLLTINPVQHSFSVNETDEFKQLVSNVCPKSLLLKYDSAGKTGYSVNTNSKFDEIKKKNDRFKLSALFRFKGNSVFANIEQEEKEEKEEKEETNIKYIAHPSLISNIRTMLQTNLNEFYENKVFNS